MNCHLNKIDTQENEKEATAQETELHQDANETPQPSLHQSGRLGT